MEGYCQYHKRQEKLCKAHILPAAFFREVLRQTTTDGLWLLSSGEQFGKRRPVGDCDSNILCADADQSFGHYDNFAITFFRPAIPNKIHKTKNGQEFVKRSDFDFGIMSLFLLSYIWRASISKLPPYAAFSIGQKYEDIIRNCLVNKDGKKKKWFSFVILWLYSERDEVIFPIRYPTRVKLDGLNFLVCYFLNFKVLIKLDNRTDPNWVSCLTELDSNDIVLLALPYRESSDHFNDLSAIRKTLTRGANW